MVLAHGVGTRTDLPVSLGLAVAAATATLLISFVGLGVLWRRARTPGPGLALPAGFGRALDSTVTQKALRMATATLFVLVCTVALVGPASSMDNLAPWVLYIVFWVGIVPVSVVLGPVWRVLNPLRFFHDVVAGLLRIDRDEGNRPLPDSWGMRPAAVSLAVFTWFELVNPDRAEPAAVGVFLLSYAAIHTTAAVVYGQRWFDRGDGFEAYSTVLGALSPLGRLPDGRPGLRNPLDRLADLPAPQGLSAVVVVLIGSTAYDGISRTAWWAAEMPGDPVTATLGLGAAMLLVCVIYQIGTWAVVTTDDPAGVRQNPAAFASTLVPIAAGYAVAHYFSLLVLDGQRAAVLASDPFHAGLDLLGTAGHTVDYTVVSTTSIALVQLVAIVTGHLAATVAAHDRALRFYPAAIAVRTQYPMLGAMIALTIGAVGLVFTA